VIKRNSNNKYGSVNMSKEGKPIEEASVTELKAFMFDLTIKRDNIAAAYKYAEQLLKAKLSADDKPPAIETEEEINVEDIS